MHLHDFGFDPGPIDGVFTVETKAVVQAYQAQYGLPLSGLLDYPTRLQLLCSGLHAGGVDRVGGLLGGLEREGMMTEPQRSKHYRCRFCGVILPAWLPVAQRSNGTMLLGHRSRQHPTEIGAFLHHMCTTEDIAPPVAAQALQVTE